MLLESFQKMQVHQNGNFLQECVHFNKGWVWNHSETKSSAAANPSSLTSLDQSSQLVSKLVFWLHNHSMFSYHWRQCAAIQSPWNSSSDRRNPLSNSLWQKNLEIFYLEPKSVLIFLISIVWMQFLILVLSGQPNPLNTAPTVQMDTTGAGLCQSCRGSGRLRGTGALAGALHPAGPCGWCWWPSDTDSSSQEVPELSQILHVSSRADKYWVICRRTGWHFPPVSSILTKGGGKKPK